MTTDPLPTARLGARPDAVAPDGSLVRLLVSSPRGSMAHFELPPGRVSRAVRHRTVEEVWFFIGGHGRMWRRRDDDELVVDVGPGVCVAIPVGASFQFCCDGPEPLRAVGTTMPPWPGDGEAEIVEGRWAASVVPDGS